MDCWQSSVDGYSGTGTVCQQYGATGCGRSHTHGGQDLANEAGAIVRAVADGTIKSVGLSETAGHYVVQDLSGTSFGPNVYVAYFHLSVDSSFPAIGSSVSAGEEIGQVGCTGTCSGPHLHLQFQSQQALGAPFCQTYDPRTALPCGGGTPHLVRGSGC